MNRNLSALSNPTIKERVMERLVPKNSLKNLRGAGLTIADEALFNLPSKNEKIKMILEKYHTKQPNKSAVARGIGSVGSVILPGGIAVKGISKLGKLGSIVKGAGIGKTMARGAVYGAAPTAVETIIKGNDDSPLIKSAASGVAGALFAGALGSAGKIAKGVKNLISPTSKMKEARIKINDIGQNLFHSLGKSDVKHIKNILQNPIESKNLNLNTLIHRSTPKTKAIADELYQRSPRAQMIIASLKDKMAKGNFPFVEETIIKSGGSGWRPDVEKLVQSKKEQVKNVSKKLYDEAEKVGKISLPARLKNEPIFEKALKKQIASLNKQDVKSKNFEPTSLKNLHHVKQDLYDQMKVQEKKGAAFESAKIGNIYNKIRESLDKASPEYSSATQIYKKYFDVKKAAKEGLDFKKKSLEQTKDALSKMASDEKYAYKTGALEHLLNEAQNLSQKSELGQIGRYVTNPQNERLLKEIIGQEKLNKLTKNVDAAKGAIETLNEIDKGSKTAQHLNNLSLRTLAGIPKGNLFALLQTGRHLISKAQHKAIAHEAKTKMNLLLNPKRLLKYETTKAPPKKDAMTSKIAGLLVHKNLQQEE